MHLNTVILRRSFCNFTGCLILLITFKVLRSSVPKYLIDLISVLPSSRYDLRRNNKGILLSNPKCFQRVTMGDRSFMAVAAVFLQTLDLPAPSAILNKNLRHFYLVKHFVSTISLYLYLTVFLRITLFCPIVNRINSFRLLIHSNCK